ncbi:hypothetical protein M378DRAFT_174689 [Amanita muscaria Koide BX008]|uniref:RNase H type-1 domain-containing protein n=1 Tax=Amanita muscaria (strain Koide BX008) TaxID=946122 RepID=A0A0C2TVM1_AMAMK|nr:hypothetical protein M378DRAFT_174689 [Amanita muscaria Koide BX008]
MNLAALQFSGTWSGANDQRNSSFHQWEPIAILNATSQTNSTETLYILSDSQCAIEGLSRHLHRWETLDSIGVKNKEIFQAVAASLRIRKGILGHSGVEGSEAADTLANQGAENDQPDTIIPEELWSKLSTETN